MVNQMTVRKAVQEDVSSILQIYNEGIEDRVATLEEDLKDAGYMQKWFLERGERYVVLVAESNHEVVGWASLNPYSHRCAYAGVADLSVYVKRDWRSKGVGSTLLTAIEAPAKENGFYKIVLFTFPFNQTGQGLYRKLGYQEVGIFHNQGRLDGNFVDVMAMEKFLE